MENKAEWTDLAGLQVQIQKAGRTIRTGYVDDVAATADALWIAAQGVDARALYEKAEGYEVLPIGERTRFNS